MPDQAHAFGQGSDARIKGEPIPKATKDQKDTDFFAFCRGWEHAAKFWGIDANWPVKPLPPVKT